MITGRNVQGFERQSAIIDDHLKHPELRTLL